MSAQAKPISEVVRDFEQSLENLRPSTRRVYVAGASSAIRAANLEFWQCPSATELLASLGKSPTEKRARISPFLDFLGDGEPKELVSDEDSAALQNWVIQRIAKQTRSAKNPSIATRRDTALIAALCAVPARGTPRKWPENCLKIDGREVLLWDASSAPKSQAVHRAVAPSDPSPPALNRRRTSQAENNSMALSPPKATKAGLLAATPLPTATINSTVIQASVKRWSRATRSRGFACVKVCVGMVSTLPHC